MKGRKRVAGETGEGGGWELSEFIMHISVISYLKINRKEKTATCVLMGFPKLRTLKQEKKSQKLVSVLALSEADANTTAWGQ